MAIVSYSCAINSDSMGCACSHNLQESAGLSKYKDISDKLGIYPVEVERLFDVFDRIDADADGLISKSELFA